MTTKRKLIRATVGLLELAKQLGNVRQACTIMGYSRDSVCRALEAIDHTRTKARSPQTKGICERFHKTGLQEFDQIAFRMLTAA